MRLVRTWAWLGLLAIAATVTLFGVGDLASGIAADPGITESVTGGSVDAARQAAPQVAALADVGTRTAGTAEIALGLAWAGIIVGGIRPRIRWAWAAGWTMPLWIGLVLIVWLTTERAVGTSLPAPMLSGPLFLVVSGLLLLGAWPTPGPSGDDRTAAAESELGAVR
jgi:hypothetical protein